MPRSRPSLRVALRVEPGKKIRLADIDPSATHGHEKESARATLQ